MAMGKSQNQGDPYCMDKISRVTTIDIELESSEPFYITPLSDLHIESSAFDLEGFRKMMRERAKLPNHRAIVIGDVMDLVVPRDLKRWTPSVQDSTLAGEDAWLNKGMDLAIERLTEFNTQYDLVTPGNHEYEFQKRHGFDVTSALARDLKCARGGYSGILRYRIHIKGNKRGGQLFTIVYHHGAWGGQSKGIIPARRWFTTWDKWNIALWGHNHQTLVTPESRFKVLKNGNIREYPVYFINTGSWVKSYSDNAAHTNYAEKAGYIPTIRATPLIKVQLACRRVGGPSGTRGYELTYSVEV